jgi:hypothetical protein
MEVAVCCDSKEEKKKEEPYATVELPQSMKLPALNEEVTITVVGKLVHAEVGHSWKYEEEHTKAVGRLKVEVARVTVKTSSEKQFAELAEDD